VTRLETATLTASFGCFFATVVVSGSATTACVTATAVVDDDGSTAAVGASSASDSSVFLVEVLLVEVLLVSADEFVVRDATVDRSARSAALVLGGFVSLQRLLDRGREAGDVSSSAASSFGDASESVPTDVCVSWDASRDAGEPVDSLRDVSVDDPLDDDSVEEDCDPDVSAGCAEATPCPVKTAAPIPRTTASEPTRPTCIPAPMPIYLPAPPAGRRCFVESRRHRRRSTASSIPQYRPTVG